MIAYEFWAAGNDKLFILMFDMSAMNAFTLSILWIIILLNHFDFKCIDIIQYIWNFDGKNIIFHFIIKTNDTINCTCAFNEVIDIALNDLFNIRMKINIYEMWSRRSWCPENWN